MEENEKDVRQLIEICRGHKVYIQTHNIPDPDAIGTAFGLQQLMIHFGLNPVITYDGTIDKLISSKMLDLFDIEMYADQDILDDMKEEDYIICVDSQKHAGNITDLPGDEIATIDHHPTTMKNAHIEYLYKDVRIVGACCSIIADYYHQLDIEPSSDVATALVYGIKMDTAKFSRGVTDVDIRAYAYLNKYMSEEKLSKMERNNLQFSDLKAYGNAIENIEVYGYFGISHIAFACPDAMVSIIADFILSLVEIEVAVVYCDRPDGMKFSVRSEREDVNSGELVAKALEGIGTGGGHMAMAGGMVPAKNYPALGDYRDNAITERFVRALGIEF